MMRERVVGSATTQSWQLWLLRASWALTPALRVLCFASGAALLSQCGDDAWDDDTGRDAGASGHGGAAAHGGKAGSGGTAPRAGSSGGGSVGVPPGPDLTTIACGTALCVSPATGFGFVTACCADEATSICGAMTLSGSCMKPDQGDPRCPTLNFRGLISLPSCCTQDDQCGLDTTRTGMPGCLDLATAVKQARVWGVSDEEVPDPRPCDAAGATHPERDAGADDAGL